MFKKTDYLIKLIYDKTYGGYVADVLNLPGCMSQGRTMKEALLNTNKALEAFQTTSQKEKRSLIDATI